MEGLKVEKTWSEIFDEENDGSIESIRKQIDKENKLKGGVLRCISQWKRIIGEIDRPHGSSKTENEYHIRFLYQQQYNDILQREIIDLKEEIKKSKGNLNCLVDNEEFMKLTLPELKMQVRNLNIEICSIKSIIAMNERQLDRESMAYAKLRNSCDLILNDVLFEEKSRLEQQEKYDKEFFAKIRQNFLDTVCAVHKSKTSCLGLSCSKSIHSSTSCPRHRTSKKHEIKNNSKQREKKEDVKLPYL